MAKPLSYQTLLEIIRKLPDEDQEYVLRFVVNNDKKVAGRLVGMDQLRLDYKAATDEVALLKERVEKLGQTNNELNDLAQRLQSRLLKAKKAKVQSDHIGATRKLQMASLECLLLRVCANPHVALDATTQVTLVDLATTIRALLEALPRQTQVAQPSGT